MTPKDERIAKHERELTRGREVQARAARQDTIERWRKARKITYFIDNDTSLHNLNEARVYIGDELVLRADKRTFPTELDIAQVGLAIKSLSDFVGVEKADPPPRPKSASALHVAETQRRLQDLHEAHQRSRLLQMNVRDLGALIGLEPLHGKN